MGRGLRPRKLITVSPKPTNHHPTFCVAAFAPKLRRQAFLGFVFVVFLIFGNAQLRLYAGQNVPPPHNLEKETDTVVSVFSFFLLYVHKDLRKCNGCHLDSGRCGENVTCFGPFSFVVWSDSGWLLSSLNCFK